MSFQPTPKQALALWHLLITGEEPSISEFAKKLLDAPSRRTLQKVGLIQLEKRGRSQHIILTERAWAWAVEHFEVELSKSKFSVPVLQALLKKLGSYLQARDIPLVEFLMEQEPPEEATEDEVEADATDAIAPGTELEDKIRQAYLAVSGGEYNVRVRLSQLRPELDRLVGNLAKTTVDETLMQMERDRKLDLMGLDDPQEIHPEDERAAIDISGEKNYILYMG